MSRIAGLATALATALVIVGLAIAVLLTPLYIHFGLAQADSAAYLGVSAAQTEALSDRTVGEMVFGPATFEFPIAEGGPRFYDDADSSHLRDARFVLDLLAGAVAAALIVLGAGLLRRRREAAFWRSVATGAGRLVVVFAIVGVLFLVAFDPAFTLFHEIFFPGGNWSFDPATDHMVQLYPIPFWQLTSAVLGELVIGLGLVVWWLARRRTAGLAGAAA